MNPASNEAMSTNIKPAAKPIFDRSGHNAPNPPPQSDKPSNLDSEADQIRKAWLQRSGRTK
jgi:hypothetical protein